MMTFLTWFRKRLLICNQHRRHLRVPVKASTDIDAEWVRCITGFKTTDERSIHTYSIFVSQHHSTPLNNRNQANVVGGPIFVTRQFLSISILIASGLWPIFIKKKTKHLSNHMTSSVNVEGWNDSIWLIGLIFSNCSIELTEDKSSSCGCTSCATYVLWLLSFNRIECVNRRRSAKMK